MDKKGKFKLALAVILIGAILFAYFVLSIPSNQTASVKNNITTEAYPLSHITLNDSSLVLYMAFDVNHTYPANVTYDYSQYNNDGTVINSAIWNQNSIIGGGYTFNGSNNIINISDSNSLDMNQTVTVMAWVYPYNISVTSSQTRVISKTGAYELMLSTGVGSCDAGSGDIQFGLTLFGASSAVLCQGTIVLNTWTHIVGTFNGSTFLIYQDGVLNGNPGITNRSDIDSNTNPLVIGNLNALNRPFNGTIDEVMIFNRTLSAKEINDTFKNQSYRFLTPASQLFENNSITTGNNRVNITTNATLLMSSNISLRLREINTGLNTTWENISDGDNQVKSFNISASTNNITLEFDFIPGRNATAQVNFYSPILRDNISVTGWIDPTLVTINVPANTTYSSSNINFNVSLNRNGSVMYSLNGGRNNLTMLYSADQVSVFGDVFNHTNNSIADGSYTFSVYANDTAGNTNYIYKT